MPIGTANNEQKIRQKEKEKTTTKMVALGYLITYARMLE